MLLTRSPLIPPASQGSSFDLHVLSTPPAFILSQDQTLRSKTKNETQPPPPEITAKAAANLKPAENQTTTHGGAQWPGKNSTNQKTIGINKLGTLLSSQTTDPPKHHPEATPHTAAQPNQGHWKRRVIFGRLPEPYTPSGFPFRSRRLRKQYTPPTPNANPPPNSHPRAEITPCCYGLSRPFGSAGWRAAMFPLPADQLARKSSWSWAWLPGSAE